MAFAAPFALPALAGMAYRVRTAPSLSRRRAARTVARLAWAAALAIVLAKGWTNYRLAWKTNPVLYPTAFGTLAGDDDKWALIRDLRQTLQVDDAAPPRLFVYPHEAWIYLALPAVNPTPYNLLMPRYNTAEQFRTAIKCLERAPRAMVLVNALFVKPRDPFAAYLKTHFHEVARLGPSGKMRVRFYRLYARNPPG